MIKLRRSNKIATFVRSKIILRLDDCVGPLSRSCSIGSESIHVSAPLAMVILGLFIGNKGRDEKLANATGKYVFKFWHLLDETLNAMLFILIGLEMLVIAKDVTSDMFLLGAEGIFIVLTGRSIGVSLPVGLMSLKIKFEKGATSLLIWGGLRGGISVALALSLSDFEWIPSNFKIIIL